MRLSLDTALCDGVGEPLCETCLRRTAERPPIHWRAMFEPKGEECEGYLEPHYTITPKGEAMLRGDE